MDFRCDDFRLLKKRVATDSESCNVDMKDDYHWQVAMWMSNVKVTKSKPTTLCGVQSVNHRPLLFEI